MQGKDKVIVNKNDNEAVTAYLDTGNILVF